MPRSLLSLAHVAATTTRLTAPLRRAPCPEGLPYSASGEHTKLVLGELGGAPAEILALKEAGVVGWPEEMDAVAHREASQPREASWYRRAAGVSAVRSSDGGVLCWTW